MTMPMMQRRPQPQLPGMAPGGPAGPMPGAPPMGGPSMPGASMPPETLGAGPPLPGMSGAGVSNLPPSRAGKGPNVRTRGPVHKKGGKTKAAKSQKKTMMAAKG